MHPQTRHITHQAGDGTASLENRSLAYVMDVAFCMVAAYALFRILYRWIDLGGSLPLFFGLYFMIGNGPWGQTLGKKLMGLRVVNANGKPMTWLQSFVRGIVIGLITILPPMFLVSLIVALRSSKRRSLQDWVANTVVVSIGN